MSTLSRLVPSARGLFIFEAAARNRSLTATAGEFNVTQPSISRSIAQLERELGIRLFDRSPKGLELTDQGRSLYAAVREGLGTIGAAITAIQEQEKVSKTVVTLSLSSSFAAHWLVPRLGAFKARFPDVDLRFDLISGIMRGVPDNIDLATRIISDDDPHYYWWDFAPEVIVPVCSPAYLEAHGKLNHEGNGHGHVFLHLTDHDLREWGRIWGSVANRTTMKGSWHEFSDYAVILEAAIRGEGIALGWVSVISTALLNGTLSPASDRLFKTGRHHRLIAPRSRSLRPIVPEISEWLALQMVKELEQLADLLKFEDE
ncbi:LysR substrate-binding domain-containing protein [Rhizobium sp. BR 362]|uniref:LysR substrate-binding domain-containing protein n=1 Tax=Rhizobium sp. BR 362 TaxID=3040670 RepID=UPI002F42C61C